MNINGAQAIIEALLEEGVTTMFGYPGGGIMPFYDELYKNQDKIRHILVRHEQAAVHAAEGYARSSGKVGVCVATAGPGATNLVTGIADAMMDSTPIVCITAQVQKEGLGAASFQEAVTDVLAENTVYAAKLKNVKTVCLAGGVASNGYLREKLTARANKDGISVLYPKPVLCTDNAAMICCAGYYEYKKGNLSTGRLNAYPSLELGDKIIM